MHTEGPIEVWNATDGGAIEIGAQILVPIIGRIAHWSPEEVLTFTLDGSEPHRVYVSTGEGRLSGKGDFSIDAIDRSMLGSDEHVLELHLARETGPVTATLRLRPTQRAPFERRFELDTTGVTGPEEVVQVIDGRWQIPDGPGHLRIAPGDEGYDRIFVVGRDTWTTGYRADISFTIDRYLPGSRFHAFGLLYKWRSHRQGDGLHLPRNWTAGLGLFSSAGPGLSIRYGEDVEYLPNGKRIGNTRLAASRVDPIRWALGRTSTRAKVLPALPQFPPGTTIQMSMTVDHGLHRLDFHALDRPRSRRTVEVESLELVESGAVGFLAAYVATTVHSFEVTPLS